MNGDSRRRALRICLAAYAAALLAAALTVRLASPLLPPGAWVPRPLAAALLADLAATAVVFGFSRAFDNSSMYDPYWSVAPPLLAVYWLGAYGGWSALTPRRAVVLLLVCLWALRLTWNCLARWQGLNHEDWRYAALRRRFGPWYWPVSLAGIHLFPTLIVFLACLSLHELMRHGSAAGAPGALGALDGAAILLTAGAVTIEAVSDRQLRRFRQRSAQAHAILAEGLWRLCRHPNYLGEGLFWGGLYLFCLAASPGSWWAGVGPLAMTVMFAALSVPMMDRHLARSRGGTGSRGPAGP